MDSIIRDGTALAVNSYLTKKQFRYIHEAIF